MKLPAALDKSRFRKSFKLDDKDREYVSTRGMDVLRSHATDFIQKRLAPSVIPNDGKQTPQTGHPVFKAQHATATCCRVCLQKFYKIPKNRNLTAAEVGGIVGIIVAWIQAQKE